MTVAPHSPPTRRLVLNGALALLFLVLGVLALQEYGVGASVFLFAVAGLLVVDAVQVTRRDARRRARG